MTAPNPAELLAQALERFDAADALCPFKKRKPPPSSKPCPTCGATAAETCRRAVGAAFDFILDARAIAAGAAK